MRKQKDLSAAFDLVTEAAAEQAGLSETPKKPVEPEPTPIKLQEARPAPADSATARFEARLVGGSQQVWKKTEVHGVTVRLSQEDLTGTIQTTVRMSKPLREAVRVASTEIGCTFEEFVREAVGMALERYSGQTDRTRG